MKPTENELMEAEFKFQEWPKTQLNATLLKHDLVISDKRTEFGMQHRQGFTRDLQPPAPQTGTPGQQCLSGLEKVKPASRTH